MGVLLFLCFQCVDFSIGMFSIFHCVSVYIFVSASKRFTLAPAGLHWGTPVRVYPFFPPLANTYLRPP